MSCEESGVKLLSLSAATMAYATTMRLAAIVAIVLPHVSTFSSIPTTPDAEDEQKRWLIAATGQARRLNSQCLRTQH